MKYDDKKLYIFIHNDDGDLKISTNDSLSVEIIEIKQSQGYSEKHTPEYLSAKDVYDIIEKEIVVLPDDYEADINYPLADILFIAYTEQYMDQYPIFSNLSEVEIQWILNETKNRDDADKLKAMRHIKRKNSFLNKTAKNMQTFHDLFI